jgi:hypothetical protein
MVPFKVFVYFIIPSLKNHNISIHLPFCNGGSMEDEWRMNGESMELERFHKHIKEEDEG